MPTSIKNNRRRVEVPSRPGNYPLDRVSEILAYRLGEIKDPKELDAKLEKLYSPKFIHGNVLVADIRNFTFTLEHEAEDRVRAFLDTAFDHASILVQRIDNGGAFVNKLLGDGLFAHIPDVAPYKVIEAAKSIMISFNRLKKAFGFKFTNLSIAITKADYSVTPIGGRHYLDYTLIGSQINSLFRMLSSTEGSLIYIGDPIRSTLKSTHHIVYVGNKEFKGIVAPVPCYSVIRKKSDTERKTGYPKLCEKADCPTCYNLCRRAWEAGQHHLGARNDKYIFNLDCDACGPKNQCWNWKNCQTRHRNIMNKEPSTCCHLCTNFRNCFHSFQLGRRGMDMLACDKNIYKSLMLC